MRNAVRKPAVARNIEKPSATRHALAIGLLAAALGTQAAPQVSGPGACGARAVDNESFLSCDGDVPTVAAGAPAQAIAAPAAWEMKRVLGARMMLVDIRETGEPMLEGAPLADVKVPYPADGDVPASLRMETSARFLGRVDAAMRGAMLGFGAPLVLVGRGDEATRSAAERLREHGYRQVYVVGGR